MTAETTTRLPEAYRALKGRSILVTGAAGFIGGALFERLCSYGLDPLGTVLRPREAESLRARGRRAAVLDLMSDEPWDAHLEGVDLVFHIAAMFRETEFGEKDHDIANHKAVVKLAEAANRTGVGRFVHCSTGGVHGSVLEIPCKETSPLHPMDAYHRTKLAGERALLAYAETLPAKGMIVTINRPTMVYGPGDMRLLKLFKAIARGRFRMIGSGKTLAHLCHIDDQIASFLLQAVAPREKVHMEAFNIASDRPYPLDAIARMIADACGVRIKRLRIPVAPVWCAALCCEILCRPFGIRPPLFRRRVGFFTHNRAFDCTKAETLLGYRSRWTTRAGIGDTVRWYREQELL